MKNIDYVLKYHNDIAKWHKEDIIDIMCPGSFHDGMNEANCQSDTCEKCWDLEIDER